MAIIKGGGSKQMGLNYNYLLYFKREHLWDALRAVADIAEGYAHPPTTFHFPDHDLILPLRADFGEESEIQHDAPKFSFAISLLFEQDEAILDYLHGLGEDESHRAPPDPDGLMRIAIGLIYLTVYADLSQHWAFEKPTDLVLFQFGTTGTRMSLLFSESMSMRKTFTDLLESVPGLCGVFDREIDGGELFWLRGQPVFADIGDVYMHPDEIGQMVQSGRR